MTDAVKEMFMEAAWRDFIDFAWRSREPNFRAMFEFDTGTPPLNLAPRSPLDMMIDAATGYTDKALAEYIEGFVNWATETQWGWEEAPAAYREKYHGSDATDKPNG